MIQRNCACCPKMIPVLSVSLLGSTAILTVPTGEIENLRKNQRICVYINTTIPTIPANTAISVSDGKSEVSIVTPCNAQYYSPKSIKNKSTLILDFYNNPAFLVLRNVKGEMRCQ